MLNKFSMITLGCSKNLADSQKILNLIQMNGLTITSPEDAEVILVNTCAFIKEAKKESIEAILKIAQYKKNKCKALVVLGCLSQRYAGTIQKEIPEVDFWAGCGDKKENFENILNYLKFNFKLKLKEKTYFKEILLTPQHWAYLKIAEGCNYTCSFCIIPKLRGKYRSIPKDKLINEAKRLVASGVKEINLVAQDTASYGIDLYHRRALNELLNNLCKIKELRWIRILYIYPSSINDELLETINKQEKICKYLDMPLQHISSKILTKMRRLSEPLKIKKLIDKIRRKIKEVVLRTTFIAGFPGENDLDFKLMLNFIEETKFEHLGAFIYSNEEGTEAFNIKEQIPEKIKKDRYKKLMELQQRISYQVNSSLINKELEILTEENLKQGTLGRTYRDAPEVDGLVYLPNCHIPPGNFVRVKIIKSKIYDLIGRLAA
ncbi:MAG: 30S ribosomal protein S12 methylthiotransferase RimO [Armatimonadetes bacterium]|nr:30S ribosomal protein S12 methylthiotransferase RimO [Armatimonadota bacterium]